MLAILIADRRGAELDPLTRRGSAALLPVAARPVLAHNLDALSQAGVERVFLVISAFPEQLRKDVGDGRQWGLQIDYLVSRGEERPADFLQRRQMPADAEYLVLRGDMLRACDLAEFVMLARAQAGNCVAGIIDGCSAGLWLCRGLEACAALPGWPLETGPVDGIALESAAMSRLDSLADFHRANLDAARGRFPRLLLPGRRIGDTLTLGRGSTCAASPAAGAQVLIGARSTVYATVQLEDTVVICDQVIIDRQASLADTVVLPGSYVGARVELRNAIVSCNDLIRVDSGSVLQVVDAFLLADLGEPEISRGVAAVLNRFAGVLLLLLSLPLWPVALGLAFRQPSRPIRRVRLWRPRSDAQDARDGFIDWEFAVTIPVLRRLPRILAVVRGQMRLVGRAPLTLAEAESRDQDWQRAADRTPAGLLGPTQILLPSDAPLEERLVSDACYAGQRSLLGDAKHLLRALAALCSRRAWQSARPGTAVGGSESAQDH